MTNRKSARAFADRVAELTATICSRPLDADLEAFLNTQCGPGSVAYGSLADACRAGVAEGWLCDREHRGIRYGRVLEATPQTHGFSVDVVDMNDIAGPHHVHPNGEIDLVMPIAAPGDPIPGGSATFDGQPAGWKVYGPGSAHRPTVCGGRALVLYLLPEGAIEFTR